MRIPKDELESRHERLRCAASDDGLDGLLFYADQVNAQGVHYAADHMVVGECAWCWLPVYGAPVLFLSEPWDESRTSAESAACELCVLGTDFTADMARYIGTGKKIGVVGLEGIPFLKLSALGKTLGGELTSATKLLDRLARIKSDYELDLIRKAVKMADAGFLRALEVAREGMADFELAAEINRAMRLMGATENFQMMDIGVGSTGMLVPDGKKLEQGDVMLFEITPAIGSITYSGQLCRTAMFGCKPAAVFLEKYEILKEAMTASLKEIRPGASAKDVAIIQNDIIGSYGYEKYCHPPYMRTRGHDFGLGGMMIEDDTDLVFEKGMSVVIHPNNYFPETGYLALGEQILVTADGIERLTKIDWKIYSCGGVHR